MASLFRLIIALVVLASGCSIIKTEDQFTADIDDAPFEANVISWTDGSSESSIFALDVKILKPRSTAGFVITALGAFEEGTFPLGLEGEGNFAAYNDFSQEKFYATTSGTLTVTSKTEDGLTGTFDMILAEVAPVAGGSTLEITNGKFDLSSAPPSDM